MVPLKRKIIISTSSLIILSVLLIIFIISPLFSEIKEISQSIPLKKQEITELEKKLENLDEFKKILSGISPNLEKTDHLFINSEVPIDFRLFLEKIAQDSKVFLKISIASSSRTTETDPWPSVAFQLNLLGPFSNFSNFLEKLESSHYLIQIQDLRLFSDLKPSGFEKFYLGDIEANLLIKVYAK